MHILKRTGVMFLLAGLLLFSACYVPDTRIFDVGGSAEDAFWPDGEDAEAAGGGETKADGLLAAGKKDHTGKYYYNLLSPEEKLWYRDIYAILSEMEKDVFLSEEGNATVGADGLDGVFQCVLNDYPELFYVRGYTYTTFTRGGTIARISFSGDYTMEPEERDRRQQKIDSAVERFLSGLPESESDYEKVRYVYEYIILGTEYDPGAEESQTIYSVLVNGRSVCQGYAKTTQYLLEKLGVEAALATGTVSGGESHAWNLVKMDGDYYYLDTTWGDASYRSPDGGNAAAGAPPGVNYDYFGLTTAQLLKTHIPDGGYAMPECTAVKDNYYVREGAYFTAWDGEAVAELFGRGQEEEKGSVTMKCADALVYQDFVEELITKKGVFKYMSGVGGRVAYACDEDKFSLTFWLVNE